MIRCITITSLENLKLKAPFLIVAILAISQVNLGSQNDLMIRIDTSLHKSSDSDLIIPILVNQDASLLGLQLQLNVGINFFIKGVTEGQLSNLDFQLLSDSLINLIWSDRIGIGEILNGGDTLFSLILAPQNIDNNVCSIISLSNGLSPTGILLSDDLLESGIILNAGPVCSISKIQMAITKVDNICKGGHGGQIQARIYGGLPPYYIEWQDSQEDIIATNVTDVSDLIAGSYNILVIDDCGSEVFDTIEILEGEPLQFSTTTMDNICAHDSMGAIQLSFDISQDSITGVRWASGETTATLVDLPTGQYPVEVVSAIRCRARDTIKLAAPPPMTASVMTTLVTCEGCTDGEIRIDVQGGTPPFNVKVTDEHQEEIDPAKAAPGLYSISIVDSNLCTTIIDVTINQLISDISDFEIVNFISPNNDGSNDILEFRQLGDYPNNTITILNRWGNEVFHAQGYQQSGIPPFDGNYRGRPLPEGNYYYVLEILGFEQPIKNTLLLVR